MSNKSKRKSKKKNNITFILFLILVIVVLGACGFTYAKYSPIVSEANNDIKYISDFILERYNKNYDVTSDIELPTFLAGYENVKINWESRNQDVISNTGKVSFPTYLDGDKNVEIIATLEVLNDDPIFTILWNVIGTKQLQVKTTLVVKALTASPKEKLEAVKNALYVPQYTNCNIGLLKEDSIFESVNITWKSSNDSVITKDGEIKGIGLANLTATLECEGEKKEVTFQVEVGTSLPRLVDFEMTFDNLNKTSYNNEYVGNNIKAVNALFTKDENNVSEDSSSLAETIDKVIRLKATKSNSAYFETTFNSVNPKEISFTYGLIAADSSKVNKASYLTVYYCKEDNKWIELSKELITSETINYKKDIELNGNISFKVEFTTEYAELKLDIDDFKIIREVNVNDVKESLLSTFSLKFTSSRYFPQTTNYGGVITWISDNENVLSSQGVVTKLSETVNVGLVAKISGFGEVINVSFNTMVLGTKSVVPVEVYFIDLGKYGLSDCGESTYIKYGNIDILIDAGDDIRTSNQAVKECIDLHSEDKVFEYVITTHPDSDHMGGMPFIFENYEINNLIHFYGTHSTNLYNKYVNAYQNEGCDTICTAIDSYNNVGECKRIINLGDNVTIEIINTKNYEGKETNTRSVVCVLNAYGVRILLTGDADNGSNPNLENDYKDAVGNIDILKVVHHGTSNGSTIPFLEAVDPEVAIICNGNYFGNKHGHPTPQAINNIYHYDNKINIYAVVGGDSLSCTEGTSYKCNVSDGTVDRNGTIKITIDAAGYKISSEYYGDKPLELSDTYYWKNNPWKEYSHQN